MTSPTARKAIDFYADDDPKTGYNRVWFNVFRLHRTLAGPIAKALRAEGINDPIWYEILLAVETAGPEGKRMSALEGQLYLAQYALSRHISRLEKAGLLRREYIAEGRRKQLLFLTEKAIGLHDRVWNAYADVIQAELSDRMSSDEAYELAYMLMQVLKGKEPDD